MNETLSLDEQERRFYINRQTAVYFRLLSPTGYIVEVYDTGVAISLMTVGYQLIGADAGLETKIIDKPE